VRDLVNTIFDQLESKHGTMLVNRALGVITAARQGIGSRNVEDILSCDDEVLNDVYQWWTPPVRRLPPLYETCFLRNSLFNMFIKDYGKDLGMTLKDT
jgi:hypothetical protein